MSRVSEIFGDLDSYNDKPAGEFILLPHGAFVLAEVVGVKGKGNACMVESKTTQIQAGLDGNHGAPKFWDHLNFITPKPVDEDGDEDDQKKGRQKIGMWARRMGVLGIDPSAVKAGFGAWDYETLFTPAIGKVVIIKTRLEAASGEYKAKSTAGDYYADTPANRKKYGLDLEL